jgi:hypothetical protein
MTSLHWLGVVFLAYAAISIAWTPFWQDGVWAIWQLILLALAFWLGSSLSNLRSIILGVAVALWLSSAMAIAQLFGEHSVLTAGASYPGLLYNPMIAGEVAALTIVGLIVYNEWWYILGVAPSLILSQSRGAWLSLAIGLVAWRFRSWWLLACVAFGFLLGVVYFHSPHDDLRLRFWDLAIHSLYPFGWGVGSWVDVLVPPYHPEYVHNDYLQLAFEFGFGAIPALFILAVCALQRSSREWPVFVTFLFMAVFSFPLHAPITAFLGALCAGRLAGDWAFAGEFGDCRGFNKLSRSNYQSPLASYAGGQTLPA